MKKSFMDGLVNVVNALANRRNPQNTNIIVSGRMQPSEMRALSISGVGSKIIRLKSGYALNDTLSFKKKHDEEVYKKYLERSVKKAVRHMLVYGRGCIVLLGGDNSDTSKALSGPVDIENTRMAVLSGDIIQPVGVTLDLRSARYMKPTSYNARGVLFHHSRVIDFTYVEPSEEDAPGYQYGGVSEFELIRAQLVNDAAVERASGAIVEKNATVWHKIKGFKEALEAGQDGSLIKYYSSLADLRSIYGDGIIDAEDDVISVAQALTNLADVDQITLRRLAMVTGIPVSALVGENVRGLNSTGAEERTIFQDTIENLQFDYIQEPLNELFSKHGLEPVEFKENQGGTANERMDFETKVLSNARALYDMGEDYLAYLKANDIIQEDPFSAFFPESEADREHESSNLPAPATTPDAKTNLTDEFKENEHSRDADGKFGSGGGSEAGKNSQKIMELLGREHSGVTGQAAISKLLEAGGGHVKGAFERPDVGKIDLAWGNDNFGLKHIIKQREAQGVDVQRFLADLDQVIEQGRFSLGKKGNFEFLHEGKVAVVTQTFQGEDMQLLLTAFKTRRK